MRRGIVGHAKASAHARSHWIRAAEGIPADRLAPDPRIPSWLDAQLARIDAITETPAPAHGAAATEAFAVARRATLRLALALLIAVKRICDETRRNALARLTADHEHGESPPTGVMAVAAMCSAPRPGPLAVPAA